MLLHGDRPLREYQEGVDGKPPYHLAARDRYRCINCGSTCHGHGWRIRYVCLYRGKSVRVWVHRLRCLGCGRTYTVIPGWVHARKIHGLSVVLSVINAFLKEGHLVRGERAKRTREICQGEYEIPGSGRRKVSGGTVRSWYYAYRKGGMSVSVK